MKLLRKIKKKILGPWLMSREIKASKKIRYWKWKGIEIKVLPGVFHPGLFHSTELMLQALEKKELINKTLLEIGSGSGVISVYAAKRGALVTALDISPTAIDCTRINAADNTVNIRAIHSDLFREIMGSGLVFDFILINPPYYPKDPKIESELAWFCGSDFGYFAELFANILKFTNESTIIWMVLSEECDLKTIISLANKSGIQFLRVQEAKKASETTQIWQLSMDKSG